MRTCTYTVAVLTVIGCLGISSATSGQTLEDLQASFAAEIDALNSRNLAATLALVHDGIVLFGIFSPFPIEGKDGFRQTVQEYFANHDHAVFVPIDPRFEIAGTTGIAWGHYQLATKPKDGPPSYSYGRYMFTYTQSGKRWLILSMHLSRLHPTS